MNKEQILAKSRQEMPKEEYKQVRAKGEHIGSIIFVIMCVILIGFNFFTNQAIREVETLFWAFFAGLVYSKYRTYKSKLTLIAFICSILASLGFLAQHVISVLNL